MRGGWPRQPVSALLVPGPAGDGDSYQPHGYKQLPRVLVCTIHLCVLIGSRDQKVLRKNTSRQAVAD